MPILQKYMMGSSAALLTCFLTAALLIIIIASARRYLDARAVGKGLSLPDGVSSWFTYAYGVVALLHLIVALTLAGDNQDMFVTVFWTGLAIPLMLLVLYHVIRGIGNDSDPKDTPANPTSYHNIRRHTSKLFYLLQYAPSLRLFLLSVVAPSTKAKRSFPKSSMGEW